MTVALEFIGSIADSRLPVIRQSEAAECGLACLAMISSFHGHKTNLNSLRMDHSISIRGTSLNELMEISSRLNLSPRALSVELASLDQLKTPCILHWEMNHFVVLASTTRDRYVIHDPAKGVRKYSKSELSDKFTGVALELTPTTSFAQVDDRRRMRLRDFWTRITGLPRVLLQTLVMSAIIQLFVLAAPFYMQLVIDEVLTKFDMDLLLTLALSFGLLIVLKEVSSAIRAHQILSLSSTLDFNMGFNLARHLFRLPISWFDKRHVGDIISRFSSTQAVRRLFAEGVVASVIDGIMAISTLILMFIYSPMLAAVAALSLVAYLLVRIIFYRPLASRTEEEIIARASEQTALIESIRAIQSIKVFGKETQRLSLWQNKFAEHINSTIRHGRLQIGFTVANGLVFGIENVLIIYLGAGLVLSGGFTVGMLFAFLAFKRHLMESAIALIEQLVEFRLLRVHLDRVADIALTEPEDRDGETTSSLPVMSTVREGAPAIALSECSFAFSRGDMPIVSNVSLEIFGGELLAIVGPSGCGKSTLLKLILGLLKPTDGEIAYNGMSISKINMMHYRRRFGTVMQDDMLLSGTIGENITFFDPKPDLDYVQKCAQLACIHNDIAKMPMGYGSLIGDMGSVLSAGQLQRVLLARALYAKPDVLLLDEATANLDPHTERVVVESIASLPATRICVAHGDQIIQKADRVMLMNEGSLHLLSKNLDTTLAHAGRNA